MAGKWNVIKRWSKMLMGKSVFHMRQCEGKYYKKDMIQGYYSDLRHKVAGAMLIDEKGVPYNETNRGNTVYFAITIFQYGLGAYDLYLETKEEQYKQKFFDAVEWAVKNQLEDGAWNAFGWSTPEAPFSSMAQSEGASLLCRAYVETQKKDYLSAAIMAVKFMLRPVEDGGTAYYKGNTITLEEASDELTILNGMMFSIWGLYDVCLLTSEPGLKEKLMRTVRTLTVLLKRYDRGYWSNYDLEKTIASPFYHDLHIEQLKVMYKLFGNIEFKETYERWIKYQNSVIKSKVAFVVKAVQKLRKIEDEIALVK